MVDKRGSADHIKGRAERGESRLNQSEGCCSVEEEVVTRADEEEEEPRRLAPAAVA